MSKHRQAAKVDRNQSNIVKELRQIPGIKVIVGHDDILVGCRGKTYWYEIKASGKSDIKKSQKNLINNFTGHYKIVWTIEQILSDIGVSDG